MSKLEAAKKIHHDLIAPSTGFAIGASTADVDLLENTLGTKLPTAYREFLLWMGRDYNGIFRGSDCFIDHVQSNQVALLELLAENGISPLETPFLAFFSHQGYSCQWFQLPASDNDPIVFSFSETNEQPVIRTIGPFSIWLAQELQALGHVHVS